MISLNRITAIIYRQLIPTFRDAARILNMFYWPSIDLTMFGFLIVWAQSNSGQTGNLTLIALTGIVGFMVINRIAVETCQSFLYELWDHHILNLFASPISIYEFTLAILAVGIIHALITLVYCFIFIFFIFKIGILLSLFKIFPFILLLIICGIIVGLVSLSFIIYFGKNIEILTWATPWLFAIFSGAYYSLELFPIWFTKIAYSLPMAWIFDGIRIALTANILPLYNLLIGFVLCVAYLILTSLFLLYMFKKSKQKGLASLE